MTLKDRILALLAAESLDDDQLAARLGVIRQQVNQTCRAMEYDGLLTRQPGSNGKIVNRLTEAGAQPPLPRSRSSSPSAPGTPITEDDVKAALAIWLEAKGFEVAVAWGHDPGIDIEAQRGVERWVIEAKGTGSYDQMSRNYFFWRHRQPASAHDGRACPLRSGDARRAAVHQSRRAVPGARSPAHAALVPPRTARRRWLLRT
jgi:hypothetical protein